MAENTIEDVNKSVEDQEQKPVYKHWKTVEFISGIKRPQAVTTTPREKGKHIRKTSEKQKKELISFFEANPNYVHVVAGAIGDSTMKNKIWSSVAKRLNEMKGGVEKSPAKWAKSWADMKVYAKARAKLTVSGQAQMNAKKPSDLDRRILNVIGQEDLLNEWENAISDDPNASLNNRQVIHEHDYQISGFQDDGEGIVEEEFTVEEHEAGQNHVIVKDIRDVMKQLKQEQQMDTMEFYIDEDIEEETGEYEEQEGVVVEEVIAPDPNAKRQKKEESGPRVVEIEERPDNPMADAVLTLAEALNNVAGALYAAADTIKLLKR